MDKLSHLILHAVEQGKWKGIKAGKHGPDITHLMFADDLLLFGEASERQMKCVTDTLEIFCDMSGQEVIIEKTSIIFSRNVERSMRSRLLHIPGYKETNSFGNYLGVPLTGRVPKRADFQYMLDQVSAKLTAWKANHLSFAGRVTLAKSVIEAVPIYPMMSTKIPKSCLADIQRMQRQFIWGDTDQKKRFHAIGWDTITTPKWQGGLGLRNLEVMNKACLLKLNWKLQSGCEDLWCKVINGKYAASTSKVTDSSLRKTLIELEPLLQQHSVWQVGDGSVIDAWSDKWIDGDLRLDQHMTIPSHLHGLKVRDIVDGNGYWNWSLLASWMPEEYQLKIAAIHPPRQENGRDIRVGVGGNSSDFSVASMYSNLCGYQSKDENTVWSRIWKIKCPERIRSFMWMAMHNRLLTNSLKKETTIHVLRDCPKAVEVWTQVIPAQSRGPFFMGELHHWCNLNIRISFECRWHGDWHALWVTTCHSLWSWRNKELFDDDFTRPYSPLQAIMRKVEYYENSSMLAGVMNPKQQTIAMISWRSPSEGFIKLNTDGACKLDRSAGCGGVL
ncbi:hypothetical protein TSUD_416550 [Trifolium subterraneum]|uniref:Reverse transcriptase zinc-binding domain-containing protein n=1 Tax=Trifolium subterraneum TaxID=3900 RepID=A0A1B5Z7U1_TRISU|nr:hypothetical protein TSUD_416550 [Trifolium subterraneum]